MCILHNFVCVCIYIYIYILYTYIHTHAYTCTFPMYTHERNCTWWVRVLCANLGSTKRAWNTKYCPTMHMCTEKRCVTRHEGGILMFSNTSMIPFVSDSYCSFDGFFMPCEAMLWHCQSISHSGEYICMDLSQTLVYQPRHLFACCLQEAPLLFWRRKRLLGKKSKSTRRSRWGVLKADTHAYVHFTLMCMCIMLAWIFTGLFFSVAFQT